MGGLDREVSVNFEDYIRMDVVSEVFLGDFLSSYTSHDGRLAGQRDQHLLQAFMRVQSPPVAYPCGKGCSGADKEPRETNPKGGEPARASGH